VNVPFLGVNRPEYILQPIFALIGGILLILVNAVGDPEVYILIVNYLKSSGYISSETAKELASILYSLAYLGGAAVLIGGLIYLFNRVFLARFFISIGAGISATVLALRIIAYGPALREYLAAAEFGKALNILLGLGVGLRLAGTLFSLLALFNYYMPLILASIASIGYFASGATLAFHLSGKYATSLELMGVIILVIGIIGSVGYLTLYRILSALALLAYIPSFLLRLFGGFFERKTLLFSLEAMFMTILMIARDPSRAKKLRRRR